MERKLYTTNRETIPVKELSHIAGTFLIEASASFLNGAGLGQGEDKNVTIPKTFQTPSGSIPYVSAQAWKRWLRNTLIEETGWKASVIKAINVNAKHNTDKVAGELNPIEFAEDDIFGYMYAQARNRNKKEEEESDEEESSTVSLQDTEPSNDLKAKAEANNKSLLDNIIGKNVKPIMRASPLAASLLVSIRDSRWRGRDEGYVHLKEGTPLPYTTEFYNTHLEGVFCLNYSRLGEFWNLGDRLELGEELAKRMIQEKKIQIKEKRKDGIIYELTDAKAKRRERTQAILKSLAVLRGGAKQAQFGTDVAPKTVVVAGMSCGNPIFNSLFADSQKGPTINTKRLKEIVDDYNDRIITPIFIGIRTGYLENEEEVRSLQDDKRFKITTPVDALTQISSNLP